MSSLSSENQLPQPLEQIAFLTCIKASDILLQGVTRLLKPSGMSISQYDLLRILRGALSDGLPCQQISERMISHNPDITRLIDRMEKAGWVRCRWCGRYNGSTGCYPICMVSNRCHSL